MGTEIALTPTYASYFSVFLFIAVALLFPVITLFVGRFLRLHNPGKVKNMPYECGMDPVGDARDRYPVRYYVIALLFLVFDVETVFIFPWAAIYASQPGGVVLFLFLEMLVFFFIVLVGYVYIWKKGALKWV